MGAKKWPQGGTRIGHATAIESESEECDWNICWAIIFQNSGTLPRFNGKINSITAIGVFSNQVNYLAHR